MQESIDFQDGTPTHGNWSVRDFNGYRQSREGCGGRWLFYVADFGRIVNGEHVECRVLCSDGSYETVPIDARGRITIRGRKYGRTFWDH